MIQFAWSSGKAKEDVLGSDWLRYFKLRETKSFQSIFTGRSHAGAVCILTNTVTCSPLVQPIQV